MVSNLCTIKVDYLVLDETTFSTYQRSELVFYFLSSFFSASEPFWSLGTVPSSEPVIQHIISFLILTVKHGLFADEENKQEHKPLR